MRHVGGYRHVFLATSAALALATLAGCGSGGSGIAEVQAQAAPVVPIAPVVDIAATQGTGEDAIAVLGGGASNKLWVVDGKYYRIITSIWADGTDGRNTPRETAAHNYTYPELHDVHAMVFKKDFSRLYTANWGAYNEPAYAIEFDPKTLKETRRAPAGKGAHHAALSPDDKYLYVANQYETFLSVIDVGTFTKIKDIDLGGMVVYPSPTMYWNGTKIDTPYMFVTVTAAPPVSNTVRASATAPAVNGVAVIEIATNTLKKMIPIGTSIHAVNLTPDGKEAWVSQTGGESSAAGVSGTGDVTVIDTSTLAIKTRFKLTLGGATHIVFSPDNKYGYVTGGGQLHKIDRVSYTRVWQTSDGTSPAHLAVTPSGKEIWTMSHAMNKSRYPYLLAGRVMAGAQVFSAVDGRLITEIPYEAVTHEVQFVPRSTFGLYVVPPPAAGSALFVSNCQACHGVAGGGGGYAPEINTGEYFGKSALALAVTSAGRASAGMPAFGARLTAAELLALADYVATLTPAH